MHGTDGAPFDSQTLILAGVVLHLIGSVIRHFVQSEAQRARLEAVERKLDAILGQLRRGA